MDDVIVRSRYPRHYAPSRRKRKSARKNSTVMETIMRQTIVALLLFILIAGVKKLDTPLTNTISDKIKMVLSQDINIGELYQQFDNLATRFREAQMQDNGTNQDQIPTDSENPAGNNGDSDNVESVPASSNVDGLEGNDGDADDISGVNEDEAEDGAGDIVDPEGGSDDKENTDSTDTDKSTADTKNTSTGSTSGNTESNSSSAEKTDRSGESSAVNYIKSYYDFAVPVSGLVSSPYGNRTHPIKKVELFHKGVDIAANHGDTIKAALGGTVLEASFEATYGNYIKLQHTNGIHTLYAHCSKLLLDKGDRVTQGDAIALVGNTGQSEGPHLHFEVRKDGQTYDPELFIELPHQ